MKKGHLFPGGHDLDTVKEGLGFEVQISPYQHLPGQIKGVKNPKNWVPSAVVNVFIENKTGHRVPDGWLWSGKVVLDVTARNLAEKDLEKQVMFSAQEKYFEIGRDTQNRMRYGAWQIKEIVDLTLQPMQTRREQYLMNFDTDVEEVEIEANLSYFISGKKGDVVYSVKEKLIYELD